MRHQSKKSPKHGLTRHPRGWVKWINGRTRWVASINEAPTAEAADSIYEQKFPQLWSDKPRIVGRATDAATVADLFIEHKLTQHKHGELSAEQWQDYKESAQDFVDIIGADTAVADMEPDDFAHIKTELSKRFGTYRLARWIIQIRSMLRWASHPPLRLPLPNYGREFGVPTRTAFRLSRKRKRDLEGSQVFDADEIQTVLDVANPALRAMILLGINCGMGPTDCATLPWSAIDKSRGVIEYARPKTGIERTCTLWPETLAAILAMPEKGDLVFQTRTGRRYVEPGSPTISLIFRKLLERCQIRRRGFYCLRRTFRTLADACGDQRAAARIMGHLVGDIGSVYVEHISEARLRRVTEYVRARVLGGYVEGLRGETILHRRRAEWIAKLKAARALREERRQQLRDGTATGAPPSPRPVSEPGHMRNRGR